ncbi:MAG: fatty acid desaturase [Acidimicrobiia bacterium]
MGEDFARRTEREHRAAIEAVVPPDELMMLGRQSLAGTAVTLGVLWLELVALLVAANWIGLRADPLAILGTVVVVVLIATRINALGVVMHEASHGFLAPNRVLNDRICNVFAAWWMFHSVREYRPAHRLHHRYLNQARDPDRISSQIAPTKHAMALLVLQDLCGVSAVKKALILWSAAESDEGSARNLGGLAGKVAAQLVVLGQFVIFQGVARGIACYVVYWLFPLLCLFSLIQRLKTITEHFDPRLWDPSFPLWVARTSAASWLQDHLIGAQMEYHFEHHVVPTIPFRGLRQLHRRLEAADFYSRYEPEVRTQVSSGGYVRYLTVALPQSRKAVVTPASELGHSQ